MKKTISIISIVIFTCLALCVCTQYILGHYDVLSDNPISDENTGLTVHFIDVGQGDCTLIESKGHFALIDAGEYSERKKVISYLYKEGVEHLDFIISTHPHSDHCGSLSEVIRHFDTPMLISPNADSDSPSWEYVLDACDERGVQYETPEVFDTYKVGAATLTVLSPATDAVYSNLNNYSVITRVEYGNSSFMLTGDAEALVEKELVRSGCDLSADVLKCGHHGSSSSTCEQFLQAVNPAAAVISCGKNNDYGHPHKEVKNILKDYNIPVYRTDLDGNIVATTDGEKIYISSGEEIVTVEKNTVTDSNALPAYIGNKNSKVFHKNTCGSVPEIISKNMVDFNTREEAEKAGYKPCGSCKP